MEWNGMRRNETTQASPQEKSDVGCEKKKPRRAYSEQTQSRKRKRMRDEMEWDRMGQTKGSRKAHSRRAERSRTEQKNMHTNIK